MYKIVLYNNGKRVKSIKSYQLYGNAIKKYRQLLKDNKVYFPKIALWNGKETDYELVLTAPPTNKPKPFYRDKHGAIKTIKTNGKFIIKQISNYEIEDTFTDKLKNSKLVFKDLIRTLVADNQVTHVIHVINNKIVIERFEDEKMMLLILKNMDAAYLLSETIKSFAKENRLGNFIFFQNPDRGSKSRIYDLLEERYAIKRSYMIRMGTR